MIKLGDRVKDTVTDFTGMVIARTTYLNGCVRCQVIGKATDNKQPEGDWIDEEQLIKTDELILGEKIKFGKEVTGGSANDPGPIDP